MTNNLGIYSTHESDRVEVVDRLHRLRSICLDLERIYTPNMESADIGEPLLPGYRRIRSGTYSELSPYVGPIHPNNEDRAIRVDDMVSAMELAPGVSKYPLSCLLAVMDGHGGAGSSQFVSTHLHHLIGRNPFYESIDYPANEALASAVEEGISSVEEDYLSWAKREMDTSGCCMCVVTIQGSVLVAANVGDCEAILIDEKGSIINLSKPHRATDPEEEQRIKNIGGCVKQGRVMGVLEPSRAIGDMDMKKRWPGCVTAEPYITVQNLPYKRGQGPSYIVVASDGVWDTLSSEAVAKTTKEGFVKHRDPHIVAHDVVMAARDAGSIDDATAVVAMLY